MRATEVSLVRPGALTPDQQQRWNDWVDTAPLPRNPCIRPEFALAVSRVRPHARVLVVGDGSRDVAYMPMDVRRRRAWPIGHEINDGDGIVVRPGIGLAMPAILRRAGLWSAHWGHRDDLPDPLAAHDTSLRPAARVRLDDGVEAWARATRSAVKQSDRKRRKLERDVGEVRFELQASLPDAARAVAEQKAEQEAERGRPWGRARIDDVARMISAVMALPEDGRVTGVISVLLAGPHAVAMAYGLHDEHMYVLSVPTVNPAFTGYSPGTILQVELIRRVTALGIAEVDLGVGMNQTKERLATHMPQVGVGEVFASPVAEAVWDAKEALWPPVRRVVQDVRRRLG